MALIEKTKEILNDKFFKNSVIFSISSFFVSSLNYFYHLLLGRILTVAEYGRLQLIISLLTQFSIINTVLGITIVHLAANKLIHEKNQIINLFFKFTFILNTFVFVLLLWTSLTKVSFALPSFWGIVIVGSIIVSALNFTYRTSFFQAKEKFMDVSAASIIIGFLKVTLAIGLAFSILREIGATLGILIAQVIGNYYLSMKSKIKTSEIYKEVIEVKGASLDKDEVKKELFFLITIGVSIFALTLMYTLDVFIVKSYFSSYDAGLYAGISTIAKMIFFISMPVATVLLPSVRNNFSQQTTLLLKSFRITTLLSFPIFAASFFFPKLVISILLGNKFSPISNLLPYLAVSILLITFINLICYYFISIKKQIYNLTICLGPILFFLLTRLNHAKIYDIIRSLIISGSILLVLMSILLLLNVRAYGKQKNLCNSSGL